jgi:dienelactone hydrolase
MKSFVFVSLMALLFVSCSHKKNISDASTYNPIVSFEEEGKTYSGKVELPKKFKERLPLVVVIHEWWGRTPYILERTKMLTDSGYGALAVDLFGGNKIVDNPSDAGALAAPFYQNPELAISRLRKFIEVAKKDPHINPSKVYVIGYCFGGTMALNLARSGENLKGVVAFHAGLSSSYKAKKIEPEILVLNGASDPMVPKKEVNAFKKEMKKVGAKFQVKEYTGATHAFTNPKATETGKKYNIPIAYNEEADKDSWKELMEFLKK